MVIDPFTGNFPLLFILTIIFIAQFLIFASLIGIKCHCVLMYIHPITRNLGNLFTYLSAFLVFLFCEPLIYLCSISYRGFLSLFILQSYSHIPGQLQKAQNGTGVCLSRGVLYWTEFFFFLHVKIFILLIWGNWAHVSQTVQIYMG